MAIVALRALGADGSERGIDQVQQAAQALHTGCLAPLDHHDEDINANISVVCQLPKWLECCTLLPLLLWWAAVAGCCCGPRHLAAQVPRG